MFQEPLGCCLGVGVFESFSQLRKNPLRLQIIDFGLACHFEHNVKMHTKAMTESPCFFWCTKTMYINAFFWVKCNHHAQMNIWQLLN